MGLVPEPGSPWENGYVESFNGKLRDELLNGERLITLHGAPSFIRCDNGPEFIAQTLQKFVTDAAIKTLFIDPGWLAPVLATLNAPMG